MLRNAMELERHELTTAERNQRLQAELDQSLDNPLSLDPMRYSDTESESSMQRSFGRPIEMTDSPDASRAASPNKMQEDPSQFGAEGEEAGLLAADGIDRSSDDDDDDFFAEFPLDRVEEMEGASRPPTEAMQEPPSATSEFPEARRPESGAPETVADASSSAVEAPSTPLAVQASSSTAPASASPQKRKKPALEIATTDTVKRKPSSPFHQSEVQRLVKAKSGNLVDLKDGTLLYISADGVKYAKYDDSIYFVECADQTNPGIRRPETSEGVEKVIEPRKYHASNLDSPDVEVEYFAVSATPSVFTAEDRLPVVQMTAGALATAESSKPVTAGSMMTRDMRDKMRTPKRKNKMNRQFPQTPKMERIESIDDQSPLQKAKEASDRDPTKQAANGDRIKRALVRNEVKEAIAPAATLAGALKPVSQPPPGEISFLGFSKFMKAVNAKLAEANMPPSLDFTQKSLKFDSAIYHITCNKSCKGTWALFVLCFVTYWHIFSVDRSCAAEFSVRSPRFRF
jgi:hypothetical protein